MDWSLTNLALLIGAVALPIPLVFLLVGSHRSKSKRDRLR